MGTVGGCCGQSRKPDFGKWCGNNGFVGGHFFLGRLNLSQRLMWVVPVLPYDTLHTCHRHNSIADNNKKTSQLTVRMSFFNSVGS